MSKTVKSFEQELQELEAIVSRLEAGEVPLEEAISQFQAGMALSKSLQATLKSAEETLVQVMQEDGSQKELD